MNLNQLKSFLAVCQTLNFTNAAKQNGIPQSSISRQINDLEAQLGAPLFYRTKRKVELTVEGRIFLPYAEEIVEAAGKGAQAVRRFCGGSEGRLAISSISTSGRFLSECLGRFGERYPNIMVDITYISSGDGLLEEGNSEYDFHFMHEEMVPAYEGFDSMITHTDELAIVHSVKHEVDMDSLGRERFILVSERESPILAMHVASFFETLPFAPNVISSSDDVHAVMVSVSANLGITILPSSQPEEFLSKTLATIPLGIDIAYAVTWRSDLLNPAARLFLDVLREFAGS